MDPTFEVVTYETPKGVALRLVGEMDLSNVGLFEQVSDGLIRDERAEIAIDLRDLTFLDCTGLRALLRLRGCAGSNEAHLTLVAGAAQVMRLFQLTGVWERFEFVEPPEPDPGSVVSQTGSGLASVGASP